MKKKNQKVGSFSHAIKFIMGVLSWTIFVILVLIAIFLIYYFVSIKIYAEKGEKFRPAIGLYTILTGSMEPNINSYDVIVDWTKFTPEDIKVGDVITFVSTSSLTKGMTITHRVIDIKQDDSGYSYQTKGDANLSPDTTYVPFANVEGKVLFRIPQLGRLQSFLATQGGWLVVVVIPALFIIISDIVKIFRLTTAKNKVEVIEEKEQKKKEQKKKEKAQIISRLQNRYIALRKPNDADPIPHKKYLRINNDQKRSRKKEIPKKIILPKRIDLPKLKK